MANFIAKYVQRGESVDYTPETAVAAGDVIFLGSLAGIAKLDIPANTLGALATVGVYDVKVSGLEFAVGDAVFFDATNKLAKKSGKYLGVCVAPCTTSNTVVSVLINVGDKEYSGT